MSTTITINPLGYDVQVPDADALEAGAPPQGIVSIVAGVIIPIAINESGQPLVAPVATIQTPLDKEHMKQLGQVLLDKAEELPDPKPQSDILIANDLGAVTQQAEELRRFKGE